MAGFGTEETAEKGDDLEEGRGNESWVKGEEESLGKIEEASAAGALEELKTEAKRVDEEVGVKLCLDFDIESKLSSSEGGILMIDDLARGVSFLSDFCEVKEEVLLAGIFPWTVTEAGGGGIKLGWLVCEKLKLESDLGLVAS